MKDCFIHVKFYCLLMTWMCSPSIQALESSGAFNRGSLAGGGPESLGPCPWKEGCGTLGSSQENTTAKGQAQQPLSTLCCSVSPHKLSLLCLLLPWHIYQQALARGWVNGATWPWTSGPWSYRWSFLSIGVLSCGHFVRAVESLMREVIRESSSHQTDIRGAALAV